ncbi:hypothetical protein CCH79_00006367 [Gambusia affinis]|uniref:Uncharacterized protein n=1 Tax=Gambusia affinis TaxID=33528 RepID=A0A315VZU7_GAMAF|nr:hypothetical protein CCH79_00006367 [Gambusia affinis]
MSSCPHVTLVTFCPSVRLPTSPSAQPVNPPNAWFLAQCPHRPGGEQSREKKNTTAGDEQMLQPWIPIKPSLLDHQKEKRLRRSMNHLKEHHQPPESRCVWRASLTVGCFSNCLMCHDIPGSPLSNFFDVIKQLFSDEKNIQASHPPGAPTSTSSPTKHAPGSRPSQTPPNDSKCPPGKDKTKMAASNRTQEHP